jgi:serine/threonine protein kinase
VAISIEKFLAISASAALLSPADIKALEASLPAEGRDQDAEAVLRELVRTGKLTRFQAAAIYQGRGAGLVLGNYTLVDRLGSGGMGQVYRARHRKMDRVVAIKVVPKKAVEEATVERFHREVRAAAKCTHPNIVVAYDADEAAGTPFLVMEFVDGADLTSVVKKQGPLAPRTAVDFVLQAAHGLAHAHEQGLIHRDIKPSNLMLDKKGVVKVLDMGLARFSANNPVGEQGSSKSNLTAGGSIMGTVDFMAPEQAMDSRAADARSDIYSLGCTLYYLLTGRPPFSGDTIMKRLTAHRQNAVPQLSSSVAAVPPGLEDVFQRMLAKRPEDRYATVRELIAALEGVQSSASEPKAASATAGSVAAAPVAAASVVAPQAPVAPVPNSDIARASVVMLPPQPQPKTASRRPKPKRSLVTTLVMLAIAGVGGLGGLSIGYWLLVFLGGPGLDVLNLWPQTPAQVAQSDTGTAVTDASTPAIELTQPVEQTNVTPPTAYTATSITPSSAAETPAEPTSQPVLRDEPAAPPKTSVAAPKVPAKTAPRTPPSPPRPAPIPADDAVAMADDVVTDIYKSDIAQAKTVDAKIALAEKILADASRSRDDLTRYYAMLSRVRKIAVEVGNPQLAGRAIGLLAGRFQIDTRDETIETLKTMAERTYPTAAYHPIASLATELVAELAEEHRWNDAEQLSESALAAARKAKEPPLLELAGDQAKEVAAARKEWKAIEAARTALANDPRDPAANLTLGRYLCFEGGDWDAGVKHLAISRDPVLQPLASRSVGVPDDPISQVSIGDVWFDAAGRANGKNKEEIRAAAAYWYARALADLSGLARTRVEERLAELAVVDDPTSSPSGTPPPKAVVVQRPVVDKPANGSTRVAPRDALTFKGHHYKVVLEKVDWNTARERCEAAGGYLACVSSPQENTFLRRAADLAMGAGVLGTDDNKLWLGGYLEGRQWHWVTGETIVYRPNSLALDGEPKSLRLVGRTWSPRDGATHLIAGYVCEWDQ